MIGTDLPRRDFLRLAGGAALLAVGAGCGSGSDSGASKAGTSTTAAAEGKPALRVAQWRHGVPTYDVWFDGFARRWGEEHGLDVVVDHYDIAELPARAEADVAARGPHDIFGFVYPPPTFEDEVIDHREIVREVEAKLGKMAPLVERSVLNPKTNKYFGFCDTWSPDTVNYRADLWDQVQRGLTPDTWDDVLQAAPKLKSLGHPLGLGMSQEVDSNLVLMDLMHSYGASIQDEGSTPVINSRATVEVVKIGTALYKRGMTDDMFSWDAYSNNRYLASGMASLILNSISAIRAVEGQQPELAPKIRLVPPLAGPAARIGLPHVTNVFVVWKFSKRQEDAGQFLVDLALSSKDSFVQSGFYNLPAFPGAVPDLAELLSNDEQARPPDKYAFLRDAPSWSSNVGHPGHANAATEEVFNQFIVPRMFAAAARGETSAEEAVKAAEATVKPIFDKWREQGKI